MRKLMYFTLGFAAASGACAYFLPKEFLKTVILAGVFLTLLSVLFTRNSRNMVRIAIVFFGCTVGLFWFSRYDRLYLNRAAALDAQIQTVSIRASDYSYETAYGAAFDGILTIGEKPYQVRTYINEAVSIQPGDTLTGQFRFRVTTPDGEEEATYHPGKGIFLIAYQRDEIAIASAPTHWMDYIAHLRAQIKGILQSTFPEKAYPFAKALLLGDSTDLDYKTDTDFKLSGIRHVIAVSGLHVSILFALISTITFRKRFLTVLLGFPTLFLFAALAGFTPSVSRSCIMSALMLLALLFDKEYDGATALSFASLVMLAANPLVITSVSFQLSVGSVAGIYLFDAPIRKWLRSPFGDSKGKPVKAFFVRWFTTSVSITLSAMTITTPLCAIYFGTVSLVGVVTNLLALWVISLIFYGILAVCLVFLLSPAAAGMLAKIISIPIRYVLLVAKVMADFPLAAVYTRSPYITAWLVFVYMLLCLFLIMRNKRPVILTCCSVLGLCLALLASWAEPMLTDLHFSMLDVGQGQCLLIQYQGNTFLVDCGGDSNTKTADIAAETLLSQGIIKLDCLILTHLDRDHAGAAANFLSRIDTELLILPAEATELSQSAIKEVIYAADDLQLSADGMEVKIFTPNFPGNSNEMSLCILFDTENCDILITGDRNSFGERSLLRNHTIPDVDILVAGHHGSKNSTCEELLSATQPEIVCISAGKDNSYGHPAPELLARLEKFNCTVYRTDQHGTILIRR